MDVEKTIWIFHSSQISTLYNNRRTQLMDNTIIKGDFINSESEKCFLGSLLLDWNVMGEVTSQIKPDDFYYNCNRIIYQTLQDLYGKVPKADLVILVNELSKKNLLEKAGGAAYISSLTDSVPSIANISYYIKQIKECGYASEMIIHGASCSKHQSKQCTGYDHGDVFNL